jgi:hypothetical protein
MHTILTPVCPLCGHPPVVTFGGRQAFCGTDNCPTLTWDMTESVDYFMATARPVEITRRPDNGT